MTFLVLIRHGETPWTVERRYQGHTDIGLSAKGRASMKRAAGRLKRLKIDAVYTSALKRAKESGKFVAGVAGKKPRVDARVNELCFGEWEGQTAAHLFKIKNKAFMSWMKGKWKTPEGGESLISLRKRIRSFLKDCVRRHKDQTAAVVSHGGAIRMMITEALGLSDNHLFSFQADPASIAVLRFAGKKDVRLLYLNVRDKIVFGPKAF